MSNGEEKDAKGNLVIGLLAHVDAGKTTLSESILYITGITRKLGRVDHKTAFLDTDEIEQNRGITVFSKEARFELPKNHVILLDTPGHVDFSVEAERTLQVLDYAILIINGAEGVQGHTATLWKLLETYEIPTFVFVNKMDMEGTNRQITINELEKTLGDGFVEFEDAKVLNQEEVALCSESLTEEFLEKGAVSCEAISEAICKREVFPVCFGSALKMEGIDMLLQTIDEYGKTPSYSQDFGAKVYKISRDRHGVRQTHMKITGGALKNKMLIDEGGRTEKVEQIRLFSGKNFTSTMEVKAGNICTVIGLSHSYAGESLGIEKEKASLKPIIAPAMNYKMILPEDKDPKLVMPKLKQLEEEDPSLNIRWNEQLQEIQVSVMGKLELEILQHIIKDRFELNVEFGEGSIIYKETIKEAVIGIGHFEPLRHYAEVQLLMEPLPVGSGIVFDTLAKEDELDRNLQRLILSHLKEREHIGVLIGAPITDMKITLIAGQGHLKHTEGGDFRQATYRAVRQGLRKAKEAGNAILLEPVYSFKITLPIENIGRALADMQKFGSKCDLPDMIDEKTAIIKGIGPVASLRDYPQEVTAYTKGQGSILLSLNGYDRCNNQDSIVESFAYDSEADLENPTGSIFCYSGSATYIPWDQVDEAAHIKNSYEKNSQGAFVEHDNYDDKYKGRNTVAGNDELEAIFLHTYGKSKRDEALMRAEKSRKTQNIGKPEPVVLPKLINKDKPKGKPHFIIDGYNLLFAWEKLKELSEINMDSAREALIEALENYASYKNIDMSVIFDGYKAQGNTGTKQKYSNIHIIYTKEAQTADRFIETRVYNKGKTCDITVVTSDQAVQMAALGDGAKRLSSREFYEELQRISKEISEKLEKQKKTVNRPLEDSFKA
jgi:small GTP-binding protein